jgi:hypothetical protein
MVQSEHRIDSAFPADSEAILAFVKLPAKPSDRSGEEAQFRDGYIVAPTLKLFRRKTMYVAELPLLQNNPESKSGCHNAPCG